MQWLILMFVLELGFTPQAGVLLYAPAQKIDLFFVEGVAYTKLEGEMLLFNTLFVGGSVRTYVTPNKGYSFSPNTSVYDFNAGLRFGKDDCIVEVAWWHRCFHPTFPYLPIYHQKLIGIEGFYDEVYIRMTVNTGD